MTQIRELNPDPSLTMTLADGRVVPAKRYSEDVIGIMEVFGKRDRSTLDLHPTPTGKEKLERSDVIFDGFSTVISLDMPFTYRNAILKVACDMVAGGVLAERQLVELEAISSNALAGSRGATMYPRE